MSNDPKKNPKATPELRQRAAVALALTQLHVLRKAAENLRNAAQCAVDYRSDAYGAFQVAGQRLVNEIEYAKLVCQTLSEAA